MEMNKSDIAVECFNIGFNCSQSVFSTYAEELGLGNKESLKIACSFGGGMARMGETCGAVTGAFMAIGLKYGKSQPQDETAKDKTYGIVNEFVDEFKLRNSSIICRELLGYDLSRPAEVKAFKEKNPSVNPCPKFVKDAVEILEKVL
jgi:C_GCAxxG_C_C family probable redox protein